MRSLAVVVLFAAVASAQLQDPAADVTAQLIPGAASSKPAHPNILHLVFDDARPNIGAYGHPEMITPNLDALAASALVFKNAFTQFAYCAPSRNSFMSGRRPDRTRALNFLTTFRQAPNGTEWVAMPQFFKEHGYFTSAAGKVYHDGMDDPPSWSYPSNQTAWLPCGKGDHIDQYHNYCGLTNDSATPYTDEDLAITEGLKRMLLAHQSGKPWWVSIGLHRPHTPYRVPAGFWGPEVYPPHSPGGDPVLPPQFPGAPQGAPFMSGNWQDGDINDPAHGCETCIIPDSRSVEYRRWYMAALTWSDHVIGMALKKLEELGEVNNTIVVFHADHGYQLGELNEWSKKTDTHLAVNVPFMIRVPWKQASQGKTTLVNAELVDLYRTLADLANLSNIQSNVQGQSLAAVFDDPSNLRPSLAEKPAFSQIGRCNCSYYSQYKEWLCDANACCKVPLGQFEYMGYTMTNSKYRFTAWVPWDNTTMKVDWSRTAAKELYNITGYDPSNFDFPGLSHNIVNQTSVADIVASMYQQLQNAVNNWY